MKKFEYLKTFNSTIQELNELGSIGWELISYACLYKRAIQDVFRDLNFKNPEFTYIFKREING